MGGQRGDEGIIEPNFFVEQILIKFKYVTKVEGLSMGSSVETFFLFFGEAARDGHEESEGDVERELERLLWELWEE